MASILIPRGQASYQCYCYLQQSRAEFRSQRYYPVEPSDLEWMAFDIRDSQLAVECALRFAGL